MKVTEIASRTAGERLAVLGGFHPGPGDDLPGIATVILLGPAEPDFWAHVNAQPEFADARPDPLDRWSRRVIGRMACDLGGKAYFPFGGPPWRPFYQWALKSGEAFASPVSLLVHKNAGLFISYRGALGLRDRVELAAASSPCDACRTRPCLSACPAGALTGRGYDTAACHDWLDTSDGADCLTLGCAVRRACPAGAAYGRLPEQSAWHMRHFHK